MIDAGRSSASYHRAKHTSLLSQCFAVIGAARMHDLRRDEPQRVAADRPFGDHFRQAADARESARLAVEHPPHDQAEHIVVHP